MLGIDQTFDLHARLNKVALNPALPASLKKRLKIEPGLLNRVKSELSGEAHTDKYWSYPNYFEIDIDDSY